MRRLLTGQPPGEAHPSSKLSEAEVQAIRERVCAGELQMSLAAEFKVSPSTICKIANGRSWSHLGAPPPIPKTRGSARPTSRLTEADIEPICKAIMKGIKIRALARRYGVCPSTITKIWKGETWTHVPRPGLPNLDPPTTSRKKVWER